MFPILVFAAVTAAAPAPHPFTVEDMLAMERVSAPCVSPDGKWVVFTLRTTDAEANRGRTDLWLASLDGSTVRRLTSHPENDADARFLADGRTILFLSSRSGSQQVWRLSLDGGEAEPVTALPIDVNAFVPIGDGKRLALALDVYPDATPDETAKRDAEQAKSKVKAQAFDELLFRHWDGFEDNKRSHVFVWSPDAAAPRQLVDLMKGMVTDSPTHPFGGTEEIAVSPDGKWLVFAARKPGRDAAWTNDVDLFRVPSDGTAKPVAFSDNPAWDGAPAFSPDGKTLAWLAMQRPGYEADRRRVVLFDWAKGTKRVLTEAWDRSPESITFSRDGRTLYTTADHLGNRAAFAIDTATGAARLLSERGNHDAVQPAGDRVLFARDTLTSPVELFSVKADGSDEKPVTRINAARVAAIQWGAFEQFSFPGARGDTVHGYLVKPAGFAPAAGKKVPVALLVHGGPQGSFGNHFHYRWNPEAYAGHGFAAIMIDFHGSTGYGQAFSDAIRGDWGGAPFEDLMKGLEAALAKYPFLDGKRAVALGASYGGYQINWINGHSDRFKALVCHDGNLDELMAYYDTEELWFPEWDHQGTPWQNPDGYTKQSPIQFVAQWKTPTLVIHGGRDYRVVDTQGMATFTALQRRGVPSRFLYFPDENHWVLKPQNSRRWHQEVLAWIDRWAAK